MDRRHFIESCGASAALLQLAGTMPAFAADARPVERQPVLLTDAARRPLRASSLRPQVNYVFHYPYEATPVFLLDLGRRVPEQTVSMGELRGQYAWPGGVGPKRSIVAFCAICSHKLVYPNRDVSFISFRKDRARRGVQNGLIHCCAEHSQYDPANGAAVVAGPAPHPLAAVLLRHDPKADTLTAYGTLGPELFDEFFEKYAARLALTGGPKPGQLAQGESPVVELEKFCRNSVQC